MICFKFCFLVNLSFIPTVCLRLFLVSLIILIVGTSARRRTFTNNSPTQNSPRSTSKKAEKINTLFTGLGTALGLRPCALLKTSGTVFPYTDLSRSTVYVRVAICNALVCCDRQTSILIIIPTRRCCSLTGPLSLCAECLCNISINKVLLSSSLLTF